MEENNMETPEQEHKTLEMRMYFFVPYNISEIQKGIQAGHAALRYARAFSADNPEVWDFVENHETWIILNGGTMNEKRDFDGVSQGSMNQLADQLLEADIRFSYFHEPDLNDGLSALCFICDERVFNREDYPDFVTWLLEIKMTDVGKEEADKNNPELWVRLRLYPDLQQEMFPEYYKEWVRFMGGVKNVFLRELTKDKKLA
jgi:hypothetical protein